MRKKAERKIRLAAAMLGDSNRYRLDEVRKRAGLYPKVFDKTILDMARLETIVLEEGCTDELSSAEIINLVRKGDRMYMYFSFADSVPREKEEQASAPGEPAQVDIVLAGIDSKAWLEFEKHCLDREGKSAQQKIVEMIGQYNRNCKE